MDSLKRSRWMLPALILTALVAVMAVTGEWPIASSIEAQASVIEMPVMEKCIAHWEAEFGPLPRGGFEGEFPDGVPVTFFLEGRGIETTPTGYLETVDAWLLQRGDEYLGTAPRAFQDRVVKKSWAYDDETYEPFLLVVWLSPIRQ